MVAAFRNTIQSLVQMGIGLIGDLAESVVYNSVTQGAYDPTTGNTTETVTTYNFNGVFSRFNINEADNQVVVSTDAKLTVAYLDLPVTPDVGDNLTVIGRTWKPVRVLSNPGSISWTIHIRAV